MIDPLRKAAGMALDYIRREGWTNSQGKEVFIALSQALAQHVDAVNMSQECVDETAKCKHEWVGLTDEEFMAIAQKYSLPTRVGLEYFKDELETKLKEKHT